MRLLRRDPDRGFLDTWLWMPKRHINVEGTKSALSPVIATDRSVEVAQLWKETEHHILVPRELYDVGTLPFPVVDCRPRAYPQVTIRSRIKLDHLPGADGVLRPTGKTVQQEAMNALLPARGGILQLGCGKGKTPIFLDLCARLSVPAIVVIDNTQLLVQWQKEIEDKLDIPDGVGLIQGDVFDWQKPIVLTTYHTLAARAASMPEEVRRWFGIGAFEEGHHAAAPVFSRCLDVFYGRRYILTATPNRDDGLHIVYRFHVGPVLYKNLVPEMTPRIYFTWTGFEPNMDDPRVAGAVKDKTGELHLKMLAGFFGGWRPRLDYVRKHVQDMTAAGRRPLVVSESVAEVVNLTALWKGCAQLYSDIPVPTPADVERLDREERQTLQERLIKINEKSANARLKTSTDRLEEQRRKIEKRLEEPPLTADIWPVMLAPEKLAKLDRLVKGSIIPQLHMPATNPTKRQQLLEKLSEVRMRLLQHEMAKAIKRELERRQRRYIRELLDVPGDVGMLIEEVEAETRLAFVRECGVLFSIAKYGREGLDNPHIDTLMALEPFSSRNILQQFMGRPSRQKEGKKTPVIVILEDNVGPLINMCVQLRRHLKEWPVDEGGPFEYELVGHPLGQRRKGTWTAAALLPGSW